VTPVATVPPARLVILGHPIAHSLSPIMQTAALRAIGVPLTYQALDVPPEQLDATLDALAREHAGGNVTIPHKEHVARRARCTPLAVRVGAVNTFWHDAGELIGHNTDVAGAVAVLQSLKPGGLRDTTCVLLGAGGSSAAVLVALTMLGCPDIALSARTPERAERLSARVGVPVRIVANAADLEAEARHAGLIINATPIGMHDDRMPIDPQRLAPDAVAFDLVYRKGLTSWIRACRAAGHAAEDGRRMLLEQGAAAFTCWFGQPAPIDVMANALAAATD
jgi:shikimate dehydrogenase